jgi:hypothetical protein
MSSGNLRETGSHVSLSGQGPLFFRVIVATRFGFSLGDGRSTAVVIAPVFEAAQPMATVPSNRVDGPSRAKQTWGIGAPALPCVPPGSSFKLRGDGGYGFLEVHILRGVRRASSSTMVATAVLRQVGGALQQLQAERAILGDPARSGIANAARSRPCSAAHRQRGTQRLRALQECNLNQFRAESSQSTDRRIHVAF